MTATPADALTLRDVSMAFGSVDVLDRVSLTVAPGSSLAVMGANGSGKTTLLKLMAGLLRPTGGGVVVGGPGPIAMVTQQPPDDRWMPITAAEVVSMGLAGELGWWRPAGSAERRRVEAAADRLDVADLLGRQFGELSGGQQQRVRIAQALVQEPGILLADEPITGLDIASQQRILEMIEHEVGVGHTVVLTTHNLDEARHCDRVALLAGRMVGHGRPDDVLRPDLLRQTFGDRVLGDHTGHDHADSLLIVDDHGHGQRHPH
ncbi:MAG: metal ABC transporter ATP-binding protein [Actinomycetota bacterium]